METKPNQTKPNQSTSLQIMYIGFGIKQPTWVDMP